MDHSTIQHNGDSHFAPQLTCRNARCLKSQSTESLAPIGFHYLAELKTFGIDLVDYNPYFFELKGFRSLTALG